MFNSTTLEVAIGMALIYLLLSLFCTAIREAIAAFFGSRASNLEMGIRSLFTNASLPLRDASGGLQRGPDGKLLSGESLASALYAHGLVQSLYRSDRVQSWRNWWGARMLPSYIPSHTFATVLIDLLFPQWNQAGTAADPAPSATQLNHMLAALGDLPESKGKEAILTLVKQAEGDLLRTRQAFETWFNDGMDRTAGWYKRRTQTILFVIGLAIAVSLNVDSIEVGRALWLSPAVRSYAVTAAEKYANASNLADATASDHASAYLNNLQALALPIGWTGKAYTWKSGPHKTSRSSSLELTWGIAILGWALTAIAMTLGAPFWFDVLNQFMVIRSTIKPREKSQVEESKH